MYGTYSQLCQLCHGLSTPDLSSESLSGLVGLPLGCFAPGVMQLLEQPSVLNPVNRQLCPETACLGTVLLACLLGTLTHRSFACFSLSLNSCLTVRGVGPNPHQRLKVLVHWHKAHAPSSCSEDETLSANPVGQNGQLALTCAV